MILQIEKITLMKIRDHRQKLTQLLSATALLAFANTLVAQGEAADSQREVTWAGEVSDIFQAKCQECHRPNSIAPMPLLTYDEAKVFAPVIKYRVENRVMPSPDTC